MSPVSIIEGSAATNPPSRIYNQKTLLSREAQGTIPKLYLKHPYLNAAGEEQCQAPECDRHTTQMGPRRTPRLLGAHTKKNIGTGVTESKWVTKTEQKIQP